MKKRMNVFLIFHLAKGSHEIMKFPRSQNEKHNKLFGAKYFFNDCSQSLVNFLKCFIW